MTPLEGASRALHEIYTDEKLRSGANDMPRWIDMGDDGRFYFSHQVRAVLAAIREPSEAMLDAAEDQEAQSPRGTARNMWKAMIAAMLEEG